MLRKSYKSGYNLTRVLAHHLGYKINKIKIYLKQKFKEIKDLQLYPERELLFLHTNLYKERSGGENERASKLKRALKEKINPLK